MSDLILNIPIVKKEKENRFVVDITDQNEVVFSFNEGGETINDVAPVPEEVVKYNISESGEFSIEIPETSQEVITDIHKDNEDLNKTIVDAENIETSTKITISNDNVNNEKIDEIEKIEDLSDVKKEDLIEDVTFFVKSQENLIDITVDEIISDKEKTTKAVSDKSNEAIAVISGSDLEGEDPTETDAQKAVKRKKLAKLRTKANIEFKNDLFYNKTFGADIENNLTAYDMTLKKADELWKDDFIRKDYEARYTVADARKEFDKVYDEVVKTYNTLHKQKREDIILSDNYNNILHTGNKMIDYSSAYGKSPEMAEKVGDLYFKQSIAGLEVSRRESFLGEQSSFFGILSPSVYKTPAEAFFKRYKDEDNQLAILKEGDTERLAEQNKMFAVSVGSDGIYQRELTSRGMGYMNVVNRSERLDSNYMFVPVYETSNEHFWYSWFDRVQKAEYEGVGDWASVFPAAIMNFGLQLGNAVVSMGQVMSVIPMGQETTMLREWSNSIKKYTPGRTYETTNNMWGFESIFTTTADAAAQLIFAATMGKSLKKYPKFANASVRGLLTLYGAGTAYDEALDNNMSEREAASYFVSTFAGLWYVNSMSKWITDSSSSKAVFGKMKDFTKGQFVSSMAVTEGKTGAESVKALTKFWTGTSKVWDKTLKNDVLNGFVQEGLEESSEELMQEVSRQVQNAYRSITGKKLDENNGFKTMTSDGYWGELANNTVFSGVIGGLSGAGAGGFKMMLNRNMKDIKNIDSYVDVLMFADEGGNKVGEQYFLKNLKMMYDKGQLGAQDLDIRDMKTIVAEGNDYSQANYNMNMILTDFLLTKKALGESADLGLFLENDVDINVAKMAKKAMTEAMDIYSKYEVDFNDFKEIQKSTLDDFNKAKTKVDKEWKNITDEDYTKLVELNDLLEGVKDGSRFQYEFFKTMVADDSLFGNSESRIDALKDKKFDNLSYTFFKKIMELSDVENENINTQLLKIAETENIEIGNDLESIKKAIAEFSKVKLITTEAKKQSIDTLTNLIKSDELYTSLEDKAEEDIKDWLNSKKGSLLASIDSDIVYTEKKIAEEDSKEIPDEKQKGFLLTDLKELNIAKSKIENIDNHSAFFLKAFNYTKTEDLENGFIKSTIQNYKQLDDVTLSKILNPLMNDNTNDYNKQYDLVNKSVSSLGPDMTLEDITTFSIGSIETKGLSDLKEKYLGVYDDIQSLQEVSKDELEKSKIDNVSFLNKILELDMETGKVTSTDKTVSEGMLSYIDLLRGFVKHYGEKGTDNYKKIIGLSMNEVGPIHFSLQIQNKFLNLMHKNIRSLNSVNRYIEGIKSGDISIVKKSKNNALKKSYAKGLWNFTKYILKPFTLSGIDVIPDVKIDYEKVETRTSYSKILNERIFTLNKELAAEKDVDKALKIKKEVDKLQQMMDKDKILQDNFIDFDRTSYLQERESKKTITEEEQKELDGYNERIRQLGSPSEVLFSIFLDENNSKVKVITDEIETLNKENTVTEESLVKELDILNKLRTKTYKRKLTDEEEIAYKGLLVSVRESNLLIKNNKTKITSLEAEAEELSNKIKTTAGDTKKRLDEEEENFWKGSLNMMTDSDEDSASVMNKEDSPMMDFIYNNLKEQFFNGKKDAPDLEHFLSFMEKAYSNKGLTIADRTLLTKTFYKILEEQSKDYSNMGKGINYEEELKSRTKKNLDNITDNFKNITFNCFN